MLRISPLIPVLVAPFLLCAVTVCADVVHKTDGGKIVGTLVEEETNDRTVVIKSRFGVIRLDRADVASIEVGEEGQAEYEKIVGNYKDTAEDQLSIANWCRDRKLKKFEQTHLQKVIEFEPDHADARRRLGYVKVNDKWVTREERKSSQGYVKHQGKFVTPEQKQRTELKKVESNIKQEYFRKIKLWQRSFRDPDEKEAARKNLLAIDDPIAVKPLVETLGERGTLEERLLLLEILQKIRTVESNRAILKLALESLDLGVRKSAAAVLKEVKTPDMVGIIAQKLGHTDNDQVNNAAELLGNLGDESAVPALVDALITRHKYTRPPTPAEIARSSTVVTTPPAAGGTAAGTGDGSAGGSTGLGGAAIGAFGVSTPPKSVTVVEDKANAKVLDALKTLTGQNFGFDRRRWQTWLRQDSLRRDKEESKL